MENLFNWDTPITKRSTGYLALNDLDDVEELPVAEESLDETLPLPADLSDNARAPRLALDVDPMPEDLDEDNVAPAAQDHVPLVKPPTLDTITEDSLELNEVDNDVDEDSDETIQPKIMKMNNDIKKRVKDHVERNITVDVMQDPERLVIDKYSKSLDEFNKLFVLIFKLALICVVACLYFNAFKRTEKKNDQLVVIPL